MKNYTLTLFFLANSFFGFGQNLISNFKFQENNMELKCTDWFNPCGNELTISCDTLEDCGVSFYQDSPSLIPEELWCLKLYGGFPQEGFAETYITGQSGTKVYKLTYFMRSDSTLSGIPAVAYASIGTGGQSAFLASKTRSDETNEWTQYTLNDTLSLDPSDTLTVRLSAAVCDFCLNEVYFDFIELTVLDTLTSVKNREPESVKIYPNPASESISFDIGETDSGEYSIEIQDFTGKAILKSLRFREKIKLDTREYASGSYIYSIRSIKSNHFISRGKFVIY